LPNVALPWSVPVGELLSTGVLVAVVLLLAAGALRQFGQLSSRGVLLDALALLPQWKFFAQREVGDDAAAFDDFHLLVRGGPDLEWEPLLWSGERRWYEVLWNPQQFARTMFCMAMEEVAAKPDAQPTAKASLILARFALAQHPAPLQLAIATTRGRGRRAPQLVWLSPWYKP
jgi:hypothetical protein